MDCKLVSLYSTHYDYDYDYDLKCNDECVWITYLEQMIRKRSRINMTDFHLYSLFSHDDGGD